MPQMRDLAGLKIDAELYRFVENGHADLLATIRDKAALDDAVKAQINAVLKDCKQRFVAGLKAAK